MFIKSILLSVTALAAKPAVPKSASSKLHSTTPAVIYTQLNSTIKGKTLEEVYGAVPEVTELQPWHVRSMSRAHRSQEYFSVREPPSCKFPVELYIVQDATASFQSHYQNMWEVQLPALIAEMSEEHPGSSFGIGTFRDKPIWSLGEPQSDYCVRFESPLSQDPSAVLNVYEHLVSQGGGDPPENQFGMLWAASQSNTPGWSDPNAARMLVLITDAAPHFEGDGFNAYGLPPVSDTFDEANNDEQCLTTYYPDAEMVARSIKAREAYLAVLIYDGDAQNNLPSDSWKWFNSYLGQTEDFVEPLGKDSTGFWKALSKILDEIEAIECGPETTDEPSTEDVVTTTVQIPETRLDTLSETYTTETKTVSETSSTVEHSQPSTTTIDQPTYTTGLFDTVPTTRDDDCKPCVDEHCPGPEVVIKIAHRPKDMALYVDN